MSRRDVIFIVGTIRSGTSALTRLLSLCGCSLPELVQGPRSFNPTGNWDPVEGLRINNEFMFAHRTTAADPEMRFHELAIDETDKAQFIKKIEQFLRTCPGTSPLVIKDHSITELTPYWISAARNLDYTPKFIIPVRLIDECVRSVRAAAPAWPQELAQHIWLKYLLLAERNSRQAPRVFIKYSSLMTDWASEISRVCKALHITLDVENNTPAQTFLDNRLYHHRARSESLKTDTIILEWCQAVYQIFSAAAADEPADLNRLDEIYQAFIGAERSFRVASNYFRTRYFNPEAITQTIERLPVWKAGSDF
jgi:hypothetical protein